MKSSFSPEQDFSDWETERLVSYSNDLTTAEDGRDIKLKKRVDRILRNRKEYENQFFDELLD